MAWGPLWCEANTFIIYSSLFISVVEIFLYDWLDSQPHITSERVSQLLGDNWIFQHSKQAETEDFYVETQIEKNHGEEGDNSL